MSRRKSSNCQIKIRKDAYKKQVASARANYLWRVLIFIIRGVHNFLKRRRESSIVARLRSNFDVFSNKLIVLDCDVSENENNKIYFPKEIGGKKDVESSNIIQDIVQNIVRKVCQREYARKRRLKIQEKKKLIDSEKDKNIMNSNRQRKTDWYNNRYRENCEFRKMEILRRKKLLCDKYRSNDDYQMMYKIRNKNSMRKKYHSNLSFCNHERIRLNRNICRRYRDNLAFREKQRSVMKLNMLNKYNNDEQFRNDFKNKMKEQVLHRYHSDPLVRLKMIKRSIEHYRINYTRQTLNQRQIYNRTRRIIRKYIGLQSVICESKENKLYLKVLKQFRKLNKEGPDYICMCCRMALFRNQVVAYSREKYIKANMSFEMQEQILSYLNYSDETKENWICKLCSSKIKKGQMPSRAISNKLELCEIPYELKKLNNLERHLIALRLPFIKIVNLSSGNISSRFAQRGTKGPVHCVPSDVEDTVKTLPRAVDRSFMIRLQLKRRLNYKAVWEEQMINPDDVINALILLTKTHPGYTDVNISEINENYLMSDKVYEEIDEVNSVVDVDENETEIISLNKTVETNDNYIQRLALGDMDHINDNDDVVDEGDDVRAKYNIGTDSCIQPADFNDFVLFEKDIYVVAPAEKNKLSSILTDKSIEALAFPHLFPDGYGSYKEDRVPDLKWKEYCKTRLFSCDSRFASDSTYIFFLQYLGDLKQVFSGINVAFRKELPMTVKQALDGVNMKFLMNKDMIYRHLQCVRGSPQFWQHRLKDLFAKIRQINFCTFFVTLSSADLRWKEFLDIFSRQFYGEIKSFYSYEEKTKLLRNNPVLAARLFEKRLNSFMNLFVKGGACCLGIITDWYIRIEMQFRGSPHAHMPLWVENTPRYRGVETDNKTRKEIVDFCDKYITTRLPSVEEDMELHNIIKEVQTHSRNHSKSCLKYHKTLCRFGFPRPVARQTFICEPIKVNDSDEKERFKKAKDILIEMNATMNVLEKQKELTWEDFDNLLLKYNWEYNDYEWSLRFVHNRPIIIHKRAPNARWVNQYNERMLRAWNANMDIQFVLDPYSCAKYLMSYTTKPEREMSLLLEETHKECREGNMSVREEMKKLTGTFFNHRQVSVQEAIYRATKMPLVYSSRGFVFVPSHSNSCKFLKSDKVLKQMDPDNSNIYMSNLADKYFDRPDDVEFDICMAEFASKYEVISINRKPKNPRTDIKYLKTLNYGVKKRCGRNAIIRFPYFNRETDRENYFENILSLYLPIRSRKDLKKPYELFYEKGDFFDSRVNCIRKVKEIVQENRKIYEAHYKETDEMETLYNGFSENAAENEWAEIVANKEKRDIWLSEINEDENPDLNSIYKKKNSNIQLDLKQTYCSTNEMKPLLESLNEEQQKIFYHVRYWCVNRLHNPNEQPLRLFITGGAGTGKSHLLKCLHYEATKIFLRKKHLDPDENIDEIHTLITAFTGAAAVNVGGVTIHSAFGIGTQSNNLHDNLSCERLNSYRCKLGSLKLLFVDEVSLIQSNLWGAMHSRLTQIMGIHSNSAIFGNIGLIAIGDFYQCGPVGSLSIYSSLLFTDHFEIIELKINQRQKKNASFAQMLNRIRILKRNETVTDDDKKALEDCHQRFLNKEYDLEALHLFAKNKDVDEHNDKMLATICNDIQTFYEIDNNAKEVKLNNTKVGYKTKKPLQLAKNARVMITKNISVSDGLANGVMGRIVDYVEINNQVSNIIIKCDLLKVGRAHRMNCKYCYGKDTICVVRENDNVDRENNNFRSKKQTKQFPLRLSWAVTIHKAQGITVDQVVMSTKDLFGPGMGYTGASRVRVEQGLFLSNLFLKKFYCNENVDKILCQMKQMKSNACVVNTSPHRINLFCHNIESLRSNFKGLQNHYLIDKADVICITETWLNDSNSNYEMFALNNYNFIFQNRSSSFQLEHPIRSQKGGGIAMYLKQNVSFKKFQSSKKLNLECIGVEIEYFDIIVITCYRSPQQNKKEFLNNLIEYLNEIKFEKKIILVGDFNEDALQSEEKYIQSKLEHLGLNNIFKDQPTTNNLSSLDCIYSNFISKTETEHAVVGTFFSFHEALTLSIDIDKKQNESTNENNMNIEKNMKSNIIGKVPNSGARRSTISNKRKRHLEENVYEKVFKRKDSRSYATVVNEEHRKKQLRLLNERKKILENLTKMDYLEIYFTIEDQLVNLGLKTIDVLGDGNCFFRALSLQIYGTENRHDDFRFAAIDYLLYNSHDFVPFLVEEIDPTVDSYIERMSTNGTYVDFLIISCTAFAIHKNIIIHEKGHKPLIIGGSDFFDDQLHVLYLPNNFHYQCVVSLDNNVAVIRAEDILFT